MPAYKDTERGSWFTQFYYYDWTGKRKLKKKRGFETKREAQAWEREFLAKQAGSPDMTFASLVDAYLEDMRTRLKETSYRAKSSTIRNYFLPSFGDIPVNKITPAVIRKWQSSMIPLGLSRLTLRIYNDQLSTIINYAVKYYGLPSNPCRTAGYMGKAKPENEMKFLTVDEFMAVLPHIKNERLRVGIALLFWSGMRVGEMLALTMDDLNFDRNEISINKSFQRINRRDVITDPKTRKGVRTITIPAAMMSRLKEYVMRLPHRDAEARIFPFQRGYFLHNIIMGCAAAGIHRIRLHDLRHSHASMLIDLDTPIMLISERLGHEDVKMTMGVYGHLYHQRRDDLTTRINQIADTAWH